MFKLTVACMLALSLSTPVSVPTGSIRMANLEPAQALALVEAKKDAKDLDWRLYSTTIKGLPRDVALLGEVHLSKAEDIASAQKVIDLFQHIATENGKDFNNDPAWTYWSTPVVGVLGMPAALLVLAIDNASWDSPMRHAKSGARVQNVRNVEALHRPSWLEEFTLLVMAGLSIVPIVFGGSILILGVRVVRDRRLIAPFKAFGKTLVIWGVFTAAGTGFLRWADDPLVTGRDPAMAEYIDRWSREIPREQGPLLVIVGKAHLPGVAKRLIDQYGFHERPIDRSLLETPKIFERP